MRSRRITAVRSARSAFFAAQDGTIERWHPRTLRGIEADPCDELQAVAKEQPKASGAIADAHKRFSGGDKINIKAQLVFEACWRKLESKWSGVWTHHCSVFCHTCPSDASTCSPCLPLALLLQKIQCPHEIVWLNGAPGAGKVILINSTFTEWVF